ncbi:hypothetical protein K435DRAFT_789702 [Dendrothele bispora CBS 962.96]|uniref:Uncharacterized protein n=1 Tax=Dendrothele bispora (strain CBS 962.96) TaxID=1314807 RepID=A0A4S8MS36_DENBC|nr:hypothetical protein K435DRAFT_789702 [Dendrothele bispora CBS 962.96]
MFLLKSMGIPGHVLGIPKMPHKTWEFPCTGNSPISPCNLGIPSMLLGIPQFDTQLGGFPVYFTHNYDEVLQIPIQITRLDDVMSFTKSPGHQTPAPQAGDTCPLGKSGGIIWLLQYARCQKRHSQNHGRIGIAAVAEEKNAK